MEEGKKLVLFKYLSEFVERMNFRAMFLKLLWIKHLNKVTLTFAFIFFFTTFFIISSVACRRRFRHFRCEFLPSLRNWIRSNAGHAFVPRCQFLIRCVSRFQLGNLISRRMSWADWEFLTVLLAVMLNLKSRRPKGSNRPGRSRTTSDSYAHLHYET